MKKLTKVRRWGFSCLLLLLLTACPQTEKRSGDFSLTLSQASLELVRGGEAEVQVNLQAANGFDGEVTLSVTGLPAGVTASLADNPTSTSTALTLTAALDAATGEATLTIAGTSGTLEHKTELELTVTEAPPVELPEEGTASWRYSSELGELQTLEVNGQSYTYELIDGLAIFQGDMILGTPEEAREFFEDVSSGDPSSSFGPQGIGTTSRRWPDGVVPYVIDYSTYPVSERGRIYVAVQDVAEFLRENTGIRLVPHTAEADYLRIQRSSDPNVCGSSWMGRTGGRQDFYLNCGFTTMIHELMHALGIAHEQTRMDRDSYVTIQFDNIKNGYAHNFQKLGAPFFSVGVYDYDSIMHYGTHAFSKNGLPTIVPTTPGVTLGGSTPTPGDIETICRLYPTEVGEAVVLEDPSNGAVFTEGEPITFRVRYRQGGVYQAELLVLESDRDGILDTFTTPATLTFNDLSIGEHVITLRKADFVPCTTAQRTIRITVEAAVEPEFDITIPDDGTTHYTYNLAVFYSSHNSVLDGAAVTWTSDVDGFMGSGETLNYTFENTGSHLITATATKGDLEVSDSINVSVETDTPEVTLLAPLAGQEVCANDPFVLQASVLDKDGTIDDAQVGWSVAGAEVAQGRNTSYTPTTAGSLSLTVSAQDQYGAEGSDSVTVSVVGCTGSAPSVAINEPELASGEDYAYIPLADQDQDDNGLYATITLAGTANDAEDGSLAAGSYYWYTSNGVVQPGGPTSGDQLILNGNDELVTLYRPADCSSGGGFSSELLLRLEVIDSDGNSSSTTRRVVFECLG